MPSYELIQTLRADKPARYSANGKRISKAEYENIKIKAGLAGGTLDCFHTQAWPLPGGRFLRKNYTSARW